MKHTKTFPFSTSTQNEYIYNSIFILILSYGCMSLFYRVSLIWTRHFWQADYNDIFFGNRTGRVFEPALQTEVWGDCFERQLWLSLTYIPFATCFAVKLSFVVYRHRSLGTEALRIPTFCDQVNALTTEHCLRYLQESTYHQFKSVYTSTSVH